MRQIVHLDFPITTNRQRVAGVLESRKVPRVLPKLTSVATLFAATARFFAANPLPGGAAQGRA